MLEENQNRPVQTKEMYKALGTKWHSLNPEEKRWADLIVNHLI